MIESSVDQGKAGRRSKEFVQSMSPVKSNY
jgi:hypothetical protein